MQRKTILSDVVQVVFFHRCHSNPEINITKIEIITLAFVENRPFFFFKYQLGKTCYRKQCRSVSDENFW